MLSNKTYAIWNFSIALLPGLFAAGNFMRGNYWLAIAEVVFVGIFLLYAVLAYYGKGMYKKHTVPNDVLGPIHAQIDASRAKQGLPPIYKEEEL